MRQEGIGLAVAEAPPQTIEQFVQRVLPDAYRLATLMLRDRVAAEDVAHDAVVAAWEKRHSLRDPAALNAWFYRIVANKCRDRLRDAQRHASLEFDPEAGPTVGDGARALADRDEIGRAIAGLTPDEQIVLALRFGRDLQVNEIARRLGEPEGTVKSRLHRARERLAAALAVQRA